MTEKKINRIPLTEGEMTMLVKATGGRYQALTFGLGSGDWIGPFPKWALLMLAESRGYEFDDEQAKEFETCD